MLNVLFHHLAQRLACKSRRGTSFGSSATGLHGNGPAIAPVHAGPKSGPVGANCVTSPERIAAVVIAPASSVSGERSSARSRLTRRPWWQNEAVSFANPARGRPRQARAGLLLLVLAAFAGCGGGARAGSGEPAASASGDPGPIHVHGLGVDPADGALFVATHTGLFRVAPGASRAQRVGGRYQDTMGFAVVGPGRFLGSGHPDLQEKLPPFLGLIESRDAGRSWRPVSLLGDVDFHVLEAGGRHIYGYGSDFRSRTPRFLRSTNGGRRWERLEAPEPLIALAIDPGDPRSLVASGERRVHRSRDGGRSWSAVAAPAAGLLTWNAAGVFLVGGDGRVWRGSGPRGPWRAGGSIGGQPAALDEGRGRELLAALHDGTIKRSTDDGARWSIRSAPD